MSLIKFFIFFSSCISWADEQVCSNTGQVVPGIEDNKTWVGLLKELAIEAASKDFKGFCEWNRMDRFTGTAKKFSSSKSVWNYREAKAAGDKDGGANALSETVVFNPWMASMLGHEKLKNSTKNELPTYFKEACKSVDMNECSKLLARDLSATNLKANYDVPKYTSSGPIKVKTSEILGVCTFLDFSAVLGCQSASEKVLKLIEIHRDAREPNMSAEIAGVPLIQDALSNKKITEPLKRVAANLWSKISAKKFEANENIFSDLVSEFKKEGFSEADAKKEAVNVLGAISTGGPNFALRINQDDVNQFPKKCIERSCNLNSVFMSAIAEGMVHADTLKMKGSNPSTYSLPEGAGFPCDIGKSYHFWMSAALSNRLVQEGSSQAAAKSAVYAAHLGYHLRSSADLRSNNVLGMARFNSIENGIRMDMTLAAAGASFGSRLDSIGTSEDLKMKEVFIKMMQKSGTNPSSKDSKFSGSISEVY